jgi:hypothetical protein
MKADATAKAWSEEITRAVAGSGLPWRVAVTWVEQNRSMFYADLVDVRSGRERRVCLAVDRFPTASDRRVEIARQLEAAAKR